jgi:hypothetical protein
MKPYELQQLRREQQTAARYGRNAISGDPEVLEDLGIPVTDETYWAHVAAGDEVRALLEAHAPVAPAQLTGRALFLKVKAEIAQRHTS